MENYLTIEYANAYGVSLSKARRPSDAEKTRYADLAKDLMFIGMTPHTELPHLTFADMPDRESDGMFYGCDNRVWIISQAEYDRYIALNDARQEELDLQETVERVLAQAEKDAHDTEREKMLSRVDSWRVTAIPIEDEGGRTVEYHHVFRIGNRAYPFTERNVFDIGVVVTYRKNDETLVFEPGVAAPENPLTDDERLCCAIVLRYGKFANAPLRM